MPIQIGRTKQVPIYEETPITVENLSATTLSNYFIITEGSSYSWSHNTEHVIGSGAGKGVGLKPQNAGSKSGTATITLEATRDLNDFRLLGRYYTPSVGKITLTVAGETILNAVSGSYGPSNPTSASAGYNAIISNRTLSKGDKIVLTYAKTSSTTTSYETYTEFVIDSTLNYIDVTSEIVGYEDKILPQTIKNIYLSPTKKVIGGWIKALSSTKQFYEGLVFKYTGSYTVSEIEINSTAYDLYTLTTSGTLTLKKGAKFWMCGGGSGGETAFKTSTSSTGGYGGSGGFVKSGDLIAGTYAIVIGSGGTANLNGGSSQISGDASYSALGGGNVSSSAYGGSTGGAPGSISSGSGGTKTAYAAQGVSTIPFGVTSLMKHCAGGGGGQAVWINSSNSLKYNNGGAGGSNGTKGSSSTSSLSSSVAATGGEYGGGNGAKYTAGATEGTFYGAGGGGGCGRYSEGTASSGATSGATGYQGVVYIAIPK